MVSYFRIGWKVRSLPAFGGAGPKNSGLLRRGDQGSEVWKRRGLPTFSRSNFINFLKNRDFQPETVNIEPRNIGVTFRVFPLTS